MEINLENQQSTTPKPQQQGGTFIDFNNMKKESEMLDIDGNTIDPVTKQIIKLNKDK
jgi:hypothetical protein